MSDLVNRLRCRYASGPVVNGEPEFGYKDTSGPMQVVLPTPIMLEAADEIERLKTVPMKYRRMEFNAQLQAENKALRDRLSVAGRTLKERTKQRDAAKARTAELRAYVTKYQRELVALKKLVRKGPHE